MVQYIIKFFTTGAIDEIVARVLTVIFATVVYYTIFYYSKKRKLMPFAYILAVIVTAVFGLSFLSTDNIAFYVWFTLSMCMVASLLFFAHDLRHDVFHFSWKKHYAESGLANVSVDDLNNSVNEIIKACQRLSKTDTGALIVLCDNIPGAILDSGIRLDAEITADLLETIFFPKTALHDGAVIISANKVVAAGCYLPLTQENNLPREFGTRHRAAIGVSESYPDITAIVVSEETGIISAMKDGQTKRYLGADQLRGIIGSAMRLTDEGEQDNIWGIIEDEEI
mgnify:FL=1